MPIKDPKKFPIRAAPDWDDVVFVCAECMRRDDGGELSSLRKWIKSEMKSLGFKKRIRVVESGCLDLCPKRGVVVAREANWRRTVRSCASTARATIRRH